MNKGIKRIIFVCFLLAFNLCVFMYNDKLSNKPIIHTFSYQEIKDNDKVNVIDYNIELNKLRKFYNNNDIVGVLSIGNTNLNEIIMQGVDNNYYLRHTVYRDYDWRGQTFLDYRVDIDNSKKIIIYGHNSESYNLPFKVLENYYSKEYYDNHKYIYITTGNGVNTYLIYSVYVEVSDWTYYNKMTFENDNDYYKHLLTLKSKSMYETGVNISSNDDILIIQTCSTLEKYSNYENKFLLIIAKKVSGENYE